MFHNHLESYAEQLLDESTERIVSDRYGLWKVTCYTEKNLVEFSTGGSGLVFNSVYWGFYYSPEDTHKAFQGYDVLMEQDAYDENTATWSEENSDNGGTSIRLRKKWFWYESHF